MIPEELRIGNWVSVFSEHYRINQILPDSIIHNYEFEDISHGFEEVDIENVEPIPLSEEWLLKFGFEKHERNPFWFRKGNLMIGLIGVVEMQSELGSTVRISSRVDSVHQLQNLVHSVTGEELILNEEK
jgi:hypothetical protein